jgi:hypothetical protein
MLRHGTAVVAASAILLFLNSGHARADEAKFDCGKEGCVGQVQVDAMIKTTPTVVKSTEPAPASPPDTCSWARVNDLGANSSWWEGNDPSAGYIEINSCAGGNPNAPGGTVVLTRFVPNGVAAPPPPDPAVLAQQAIGQLTVPKPTVGVGPDRATMAVNLWTWLWVDNLPPVTVTVAAGGVSVTATATLTSTTWSLGEPAATGGPYEAGPPVTVTCAGAGTPPPPGYDWKSEPPCGHMYQWRSTKERTGGAGTWPVTATTTWAVAWASNTGVTGADTLTATTADQFDVSEYRVVLVNSPGG